MIRLLSGISGAAGSAHPVLMESGIKLLAFAGGGRLVSLMRPHFFGIFLLASPFAAQGAVSLPAGSPQENAGKVAGPAKATGPAKEAIEAFEAGRHLHAVELAGPLAEKGDADALYLMGFAHETGQGVEASREKALEFYRKAAAGKHKDGVYRLSFLLLASEDEKERGEAGRALEAAAKDDPAVAGRILGEAYLRGRLSGEANPKQAITWWTRAGEAGDVPSLLLMARLYEGQFGETEVSDNAKAYAAYEKAAELGDAGAMAAYGSRLLGGVKELRNEKKGREWLEKALQKKEHSAFLALGDYEENVKEDLKAALSYYERGKDVGQIDSMLRAANFYIEGKGTEKDADRGWAIVETAAESGSAVAHFQLAVRYFSDDQPDPARGYGHLLVAGNGGLVEAQNELGLLYLSGRLAAADAVAGVAWLVRASQAGYAPAQNNLATLYEQGAGGVARSFENAGQLYSLAANQGHAAATLGLARILAAGSTELEKAWALAMLATERGEEGGKALADQISTGFDAARKDAAAKELKAMKAGTPSKPAPAN